MIYKTNAEVKEFYVQRIRDLESEHSILRSKQSYLPLLRLISFLSATVFIYFFIKNPGWLDGSSSLLSITAFIYAGIKDSHLKKKIQINRIRELINRQELDALNGNFSMFDPGSEYVDPYHPYSFDLDIFGVDSLFQYMNRCRTVFGKDRLAAWLQDSYSCSKRMEQRQEAIEELSGQTEFRQKLQLLFTENGISKADKDELLSWLQSDKEMPKKSLLTILAWVLPVLTLGSLLLTLFSVLPYTIFLVLFLLQLFMIGMFMKRLNREHTAISGKMKILNKISESLALITTTSFDSSLLKECKSNKLGSDNPPGAIKRLAGLLNLLDSNLNILVAIILNGILMFSIHILLRIEKWKQQHRSSVAGWFEVIAVFEAMSSLGNFRFNNPSYNFPSRAATGEHLYFAEGLGHPLIPGDECVTNSLELAGWKHYCLITGANMSGKTTFLRTAGINAVLAMTGAPVFASRMIFSPAPVFSSIRTTDSLSRKESYFYAELKRLKNINEELKKGKPCLVLLDEVFKGTNSRDKHLGTLALVRQLLALGSSGLITTHDLAVSSLAEEFPDQIQNLCFEIRFEQDKMIIDYILRKGVCRNLNAVYLMKRMGISADEH